MHLPSLHSVDCTSLLLVLVGWFVCLLHLYCPNRISPMGNSGCFPWEKPAMTESRYSTYCACWVFQCFYNPPNSDMDYRIFNLCSDVYACNHKRGCTDTIRESALKVD